MKESFNFVISGYAVEWYHSADRDEASATASAGRLIKKHWGSVVGGSLLLQLFYILDLIIDCFYVQKLINLAFVNF